MNHHKKFILTPISGILKEAVLSCKNISKGIETYPLSDYIMQSVFIKMTGAQEQKMKCIMWEIAHNDLTFRYDFLKTSQSEYSCYADKQKVFLSLINQIIVIDKKINIDKKNILNNSSISRLFDGTILSIWSQKSYKNYQKLWNKVTEKNFAIGSMINPQNELKDNQNKHKKEPLYLLNKSDDKICLHNIYENHLFKNRNRIAHNTKSYQHNLPTLNSLRENNFVFENYFFWFSTLILIDHIFIDLYKIYLETLNQKKFM